MTKARTSEDVIPLRPDGLQLRERRALQRRMWRLQRLAWIGFALVVVTALAGATGRGGYLHHQQIVLTSGTIDAPRITRWGASDRLTVTFAGPDMGPDGRHTLRLDAPFFSMFDVESIQPEPRLTRLSRDGQQLEFEAAGPGPHRVDLSIRAGQFGRVQFNVVLDGVASDLATLVLP